MMSFQHLLLTFSIFLITSDLYGQWTTGFGGGVELNNSNNDNPVLLYNSDVPSPLFYGGGKLRVADDGTNGAFGNLVTFHGLRLGGISSEEMFRLNFTRYLPEMRNAALIVGTENQTDQKFVIDSEGDASFEGSLRLLDLGYSDTSSIAMRVRGKEALWFDGTYFSWGFGGTYNRFADPVIFGSSGAPASGIQMRIDQGALQIQNQDIFLDKSSGGKIAFRTDDGSLTKSSISVNGSATEIEALSRLLFHINGSEELGLLQDQVTVSGALEMSQDRAINFHSDTFFTVPRASIKREANGTLRMSNLEDNKELILNTENGEITISNAETTITLDGVNVGINEKNPLHSLHVNGDVGITGEFFALSDRRVKRAIENIDNAENLLSKIRPVTYYYRNIKEDHLTLPKDVQYGLIAQEVENILPSLVTEHVSDGEPGNGETLLKGLNYTAFIPILIKGHQEQAVQLEKYEELLEVLIEKVKRLENALDR